MNPTSQQFIDFQRTLTKEKQKINRLFQANPEGVFAYYIASLSNIAMMKESRVTLPRELAHDFTDLSNHHIQEIREKTVEVVNGETTRMVNIHQCVNLFLNPFNNTYWQFRRNAIIRKDEDPFSSVVGIIEFDLNKVFSLKNVFWFISDNNLASGSESHTNIPFPDYKEFNWKDIYSIGNKKDDLNHARSAEILVYNLEHDAGTGLPLSSASRLLVLDSDLGRIENDKAKFTITTFHDHENCSALSDPLSNDRYFATKVHRIIELKEPLYIFTRTIRRISRIEQENVLSLIDNFINQAFIFSTNHGVGHTIRVMFWISVLAEISNSKGLVISEQEKTTALLAGFFHDLCRQNDYAEPKHGEQAADHFRKIISSRLPLEFAQRCLFAIKIHSIDKDPKDADVIWQLLKDADALDRGRSGSPNSETGCNSKCFRLPFLTKNSALVEELTWAGYYLPRVCANINWTNQTCQDFSQNLLSSFNSVVEYSEASDTNNIPQTIQNILNSYRTIYGLF